MSLAKIEQTAGDTGGGERIGYLDGWRGLAIALVLVHHFFPVKGMDLGRLGVDIFFCLSGLLMSTILFVKRTPLPVFYERRFSRIIPVFFLFVITVFTTAFFVGKPIDLTELFSTVSFLRTYIPRDPHIWSSTLPIGHLWSLNVEEHCYVFMSLLTLCAFLRRREFLVLGIVGFAAIVIERYYAGHFHLPVIHIRTECSASFVLFSAGYCLVKHRFERYVTPVMPIVALAIAVSSYAGWFIYFTPKLILQPVLLAFTANHLGIVHHAMRRFLMWTPLRLMGHWSYSIYLWQQPFHIYREKLYPGVALGMALVLGIISFYCFENPVRQWLNERRYLFFLQKYLRTGYT